MSNRNEFEIDAKGTLTKYNGPGGDVVIPDGVTNIGNHAFEDCTSLTNITIPNSVTNIGWGAFIRCTSLTSITIPSSVASIGYHAFSGCSSLTSIAIPDNVTRIGRWTFYDCTSLTSITFPKSMTYIDDGPVFTGCTSLNSIAVGEGNPVYHSSGNCLIKTKSKTLVIGGQSSMIPSDGSVTSIGNSAFSDRSSLTSIVIPESVTNIGYNAFRDCSGLTSVTIPEGVTSIGSGTFSGCSGLTSITIPDSVTSIGCKAFNGCTSLTSIIIPESVTSIDEKAFEDCTSLTRITIPEGVTSIGNDAFCGCSSLTSIAIPASVTCIGSGVFARCTSLTSINIPDSVTSIGNNAFAECTGLTSIAIPASVTSIDYYAFAGCSKLENLSISNPKCKLGFDILGETFPHGLINQFELLYPLFDSATFQKYITGIWSKLSLHTQAKIYLCRQGKDMLAFYAENIKDVEALGNALLEELPDNPTAKECGAVAGYMTMYSQKAPAELLQRMYERLKAVKSAAKALKALETNLELMMLLQPKVLSPLEQRMLDTLQKQNMTAKDWGDKFKEYYVLNMSALPEVKCKNGTKAPASALAWLLTLHETLSVEKVYSQWESERTVVTVEYDKPGLCPEAEELIGELDGDSFHDFISTLIKDTLSQAERGKKLYLAYPLSRYADEGQMAEIATIASRLRKEAQKEIFDSASLYNNTRAAMLFADKRGCLYEYAKLRGMKEEELRDRVLSDVGMDENGGKVYDLGNQKVTARLQADLSFLIELPDGKTAKSLPKKGADADKYAAANADFSNMKKNVKKIVTNRKNILFEEFLEGKSRSAQSWCETYLNNPVLKSVASLLVWNQRNLTFTLKSGQPVDSAGQPYQIFQSTPIALAHPMRLKPEVVRAWQIYFVSNGIKQPFIQIWEPVIDPATIQRDRYKGIKIPGFRFMKQEKHGISVYYNWNWHEMEYCFAECSVSVKRVNEPPLCTTWNNRGDKVLDYSNQGMDPQELFEIQNFSFSKYTRQVNHIVGLLDKWTILDLILKDDESIVEKLPQFTLAQIEEFLRVATENNCTNVTAALLEFKHDNFEDFDPMAEFTLDL